MAGLPVVRDAHLKRSCPLCGRALQLKAGAGKSVPRPAAAEVGSEVVARSRPELGQGRDWVGSRAAVCTRSCPDRAFTVTPVGVWSCPEKRGTPAGCLTLAQQQVESSPRAWSPGSDPPLGSEEGKTGHPCFPGGLLPGGAPGAPQGAGWAFHRAASRSVPSQACGRCVWSWWLRTRWVPGLSGGGGCPCGGGPAASSVLQRGPQDRAGGPGSSGEDLVLRPGLSPAAPPPSPLAPCSQGQPRLSRWVCGPSPIRAP